MKTICVYADEGVCPISLKCLWKALHDEELCQNFILKKTDSQSLIRDAWEETTQLVIVPGGRDIYYHRALEGVGNAKLRSFVQQGGSYLGLCAGGYYGCADIEFELGNALEVTGDRELAFFPGKACGPAYGLGIFRYDREAGARIARLSTPLGSSAAYFNGGCAFITPEAYSNVNVLGRYCDIENSPAAIVECKVGQGRAILCGTHPEYSAAYLPINHPLQPILKEVESARKQLFSHLLAKLLLIHPKP